MSSSVAPVMVVLPGQDQFTCLFEIDGLGGGFFLGAKTVSHGGLLAAQIAGAAGVVQVDLAQGNDVHLAHVDGALEAELGGHGGGCHPVLPGTGLCNNFLFAHTFS